MYYLTPEDILFIHSALIDETGGLHGVRDVGAIESAAGRPRQAFGGADLYPSLYEKAAAFFQSIVHFHPFFDGNKRTAIAAAVVFLEKNGYVLYATDKEVELFTLQATTHHLDIDALAQWLKKYSRKL